MFIFKHKVVLSAGWLVGFGLLAHNVLEMSYVFERGTVTALGYRDEVLEPYVHLFQGCSWP